MAAPARPHPVSSLDQGIRLTPRPARRQCTSLASAHDTGVEPAGAKLRRQDESASRSSRRSLTPLKATRSELAEEISERYPSVPDPAGLAELVGESERALRDRALPERKAVMEAVVAEIRVRDRRHIEPVGRVPVGPAYGLVPRQESNLRLAV